jgi:hypothetical protein
LSKISTVKLKNGWVWWLKPVILATQEEDSLRIAVQGQPKQKVHKIQSQLMAGYSGACLPSLDMWRSINRRIMVQA